MWTYVAINLSDSDSGLALMMLLDLLPSPDRDCDDPTLL